MHQEVVGSFGRYGADIDRFDEPVVFLYGPQFTVVQGGEKRFGIRKVDIRFVSFLIDLFKGFRIGSLVLLSAITDVVVLHQLPVLCVG